jgi:hypothetical protein
MTKATRPIAAASGTTLDGGARFPNEFSIIVGAFAPSQVLNFRTLAYVANCYGELRLLHGATPAGIKPPVSPPSPGPSRTDLEVLAQQIRRSLQPDLTMSNHRQMFYMLANVHH